MLKDLGNVIYFDLETGGLDHSRHPITQIAAIHPKSGDEFECKIQVDVTECDPRALEINGYSQAVWDAEAINPQEAARRFEALMKKHAVADRVSKKGYKFCVAILAAYNGTRFDDPFLRSWWKRISGPFLPADFRVYDPMQLAMWMLPGRKSYKLQDLADDLGLDKGKAHDALGDVRTTIALVEHLRGMVFNPREAKSMFAL